MKMDEISAFTITLNLKFLWAVKKGTLSRYSLYGGKIDLIVNKVM